MRNERESPDFGRVIVAVGNEFEATLASAIGQARTIFAATDRPTSPLSGESVREPERGWADQWINGLIYSKEFLRCVCITPELRLM